MTKQNKPLQATNAPRMVDISKVFTPTGYAEFKGISRQRIYAMIDSKIIKPENVYHVTGGTLIVHEESEGEVKPVEKRKITFKRQEVTIADPADKIAGLDFNSDEWE